MLVKCQRTGEKTAKPSQCNYCGRFIALKSVKSSKRVSRKDILTITICKDCWGKMEIRKKYRNNEVVVA